MPPKYPPALLAVLPPYIATTINVKLQARLHRYARAKAR